MSRIAFTGLALCVVLAGCGLMAPRPDVPVARIGVYRIYAVPPEERPETTRNDAATAVADVDQASSSVPWDAAMIEDIRRMLGYLPR